MFPVGVPYWDTDIRRLVIFEGQDAISGDAAWVDVMGNPISLLYQEKVIGSSGNFAGFNGNGDLADSGSNASDFEPSSY